MAKRLIVQYAEALKALEQQETWIKEHGGNVDGYIANYKGHYEDEAQDRNYARQIYVADRAHHRRLYVAARDIAKKIEKRY
jgi:hypothetical protein